MTTEVVTVEPETPVCEAVIRLLRAGVKRLPVVDSDRRMVGIVSRRDLLEPFLRSDEDLRREIVEDVVLDAMWLDPSTIDVAVDRGVVRLRGEVDLQSTKEILVRVVDQVDGVVGVVDELGYRRTDRGVRPPGPPPGWPSPSPRGWTGRRERSGPNGRPHDRDRGDERRREKEM